MIRPDERSAFVSWARASARPLSGTGPELTDADLAVLADIVGDARVVGIGESWHRTHELLSLKSRLARYLVERLGFTAVIFTGSLPGSDRIDAYVAGGDGDPAALLGLFGQPMNLHGEMADLLDALRARNRAGTGAPVHVLGLDSVYPGAGIEDLVAYLERVDPGYELPGRDTLVAMAAGFAAAPVGAQSAIAGAVQLYDALPVEERARLHAAFADALARLQLRAADHVRRSSVREHAWATRMAVVGLQFDEILASRERSNPESVELRDLAWAENVAWALDRLGPSGRVLYFAHNVHVARETYAERSTLQQVRSAGGFLGEWLGRGFVALGTCVGTGRLSGAGPGPVELPDGDEDGIDRALEEVGAEAFLLDVRTPTGDAGDWAEEPRAMRASGGLRPVYRLPSAFDGIAYVDRIGPGRPLN